jgi:hypothetical protein
MTSVRHVTFLQYQKYNVTSFTTIGYLYDCVTHTSFGNVWKVNVKAYAHFNKTAIVCLTFIYNYDNMLLGILVIIALFWFTLTFPKHKQNIILYIHVRNV